MRYDFVERHRGRWPVRLMCRVLHVSPGGYYDWRGRPQSTRAARHEALVVSIKAIHGEVKARYGSPRIHAELVARGEPCCVNTVARLMRRRGSPPRRSGSSAARPTRTTTAPWPRTCWIASSSRRPRIGPGRPTSPTSRPARAGSTWRPWRTSYSRRIVGWSMGSRIDSRLVVDALEMALAGRRPGEGLVAHSDRGSQYASEHYQGLLAGHGITCSMSRRANCWDNAPMESFFASLKKELTRGEIFATREEARASLFEYIEVFFNRIRRHSSLGYKSPAEYERAA